MGYSLAQMRELEETINAIPCDLVLVATPIDLERLIKLKKQSLRVTYDVEELGPPRLPELIRTFVQKHAPAPLRTLSQ